MIKQFSINTLYSMNVTKEDLFKGLGFTFDYALPQPWLDELVARPGAPSYRTVLSTTVWAYPPGLFMGKPLTVCTEVQSAIDTMYD